MRAPRACEQGMTISVLEYNPYDERVVTTGRVVLPEAYVSEDSKQVVFGGVYNGAHGPERVTEWVRGSQTVRAYLS